MTAFLQSLAETSVALGIVIALLLLLNPLFDKRYTARWRYWVWMLIAIRLILPFPITLPVATVNIPIPEREITVAVDSSQLPDLAEPVSPQESLTVDQEASVSYAEQMREYQQALTQYHATMDAARRQAAKTIPLTEVLALLWMAGAALFLLWQGVSYLVFRHMVRRWSTLPKRQQTIDAMEKECAASGVAKAFPVQICPRVSGPMVVGAWSPILLLPNEEYSPPALSFILRHELVHVRRRDVLYKLLMQLARVLHWFNPLVWLMVKEANRDVEMSCDEAVTRGMGREQRYDYARTILECVRSRATHAPCAFTTSFYGGKHTLKQRFAHIFDTTRKRRGTAALSLVLAVALIAGSFVACGSHEQGTAENSFQMKLISEGEQDRYEAVWGGDAELRIQLDFPHGTQVSSDAHKANIPVPEATDLIINRLSSQEAGEHHLQIQETTGVLTDMVVVLGGYQVQQLICPQDTSDFSQTEQAPFLYQYYVPLEDGTVLLLAFHNTGSDNQEAIDMQQGIISSLTVVSQTEKDSQKLYEELLLGFGAEYAPDENGEQALYPREGSLYYIDRLAGTRDQGPDILGCWVYSYLLTHPDVAKTYQEGTGYRVPAAEYARLVYLNLADIGDFAYWNEEYLPESRFYDATSASYLLTPEMGFATRYSGDYTGQSAGAVVPKIVIRSVEESGTSIRFSLTLSYGGEEPREDYTSLDVQRQPDGHYSYSSYGIDHFYTSNNDLTGEFSQWSNSMQHSFTSGNTVIKDWKELYLDFVACYAMDYGKAHGGSRFNAYTYLYDNERIDEAPTFGAELVESSIRHYFDVTPEEIRAAAGECFLGDRYQFYGFGMVIPPIVEGEIDSSYLVDDTTIRYSGLYKWYSSDESGAKGELLRISRLTIDQTIQPGETASYGPDSSWKYVENEITFDKLNDKPSDYAGKIAASADGRYELYRLSPPDDIYYGYEAVSYNTETGNLCYLGWIAYDDASFITKDGRLISKSGYRPQAQDLTTGEVTTLLEDIFPLSNDSPIIGKPCILAARYDAANHLYIVMSTPYFSTTANDFDFDKTPGEGTVMVFDDSFALLRSIPTGRMAESSNKFYYGPAWSVFELTGDGRVIIDKGGATVDYRNGTTTEGSSAAYRCTADEGLRMRSEPSTAGEVVGRIDYEAIFYVDETRDGWCHGTYNGISGWASAEYLTME